MQKSRVYLHFCRRETQRKLAFTVHHRGSTKNIQDLRNFAHFAQKVSTRKYKKKPALDGERVYFEKCAQQESNLYLQLRRLTLYPLSYGRNKLFLADYRLPNYFNIFIFSFQIFFSNVKIILFTSVFIISFSGPISLPETAIINL